MLNLDLEYRRGVLFLRLNGTLNKYTSFILDDAIKRVVNKGGIKYLLINFENLRSIDINGINTILNCYNKYFKNDGKLMICGYNPNVDKMLNTSKILSCIYMLNNEAAAFNLVNI